MSDEQGYTAGCGRCKALEEALRAYIDRDHAEAIRAEEKRDRAYRTHGPWCRCDHCMKLWPTAWKLPALAQGKP